MPSTPFGLIVSMATNTRPARLRRTGGRTQAFFPYRKTRSASRSAPPSRPWCAKADHAPAKTVGFRHLWGQAKREELLETAEAEPDDLYNTIEPVLPLGLPFVQTAVSEAWFDWPALPELFPKSFPGVKTSRDGFLVDVDLDRIKARVGDYFDAGLSHEEIARRYPGVVKTTAGFNARAVRDSLLARSGPDEAGFIPLCLSAIRYPLAVLGGGWRFA